MEQIYYFIKAIQDINPFCNFHLHLCFAPEIYSEKGMMDKLKISNNIHVHYMHTDGSPIVLQRTDLNWGEIYDKIK